MICVLSRSVVYLAIAHRVPENQDLKLCWCRRGPVYTDIAEGEDHRGRPLNPVAGFDLGVGAAIALRYVNFGANR